MDQPNLLADRHVTVSVSDGHQFVFRSGTPECNEALEMLQGRYTDEEIVDGGETTITPKR